MIVSQLMTSNPTVVSMDDTLEKAMNIFASIHFHHLLVVEDKKLIGLFTDSDLFKHISPTLGTRDESHRDITLGNKAVHTIMKRDIVVITEDQPISNAVDLFYEKNISCLPVVNALHQPIGIITWRDIIKLLAKRARSKKAKKQK